ncbi:MAG: DUF2851 family protein [Marinilabiliaceae bacterium]
MSEEFLHFIWQHKLYNPGVFYTSQDQLLEVIDPGLHNRNAGPDFFNAKIKLDGILWAGNIEIHKFASEWFRHGHQNDPLYDNVILHVVVHHDENAYSSKGRVLPVWCMDIDDAIEARYRSLYDHRGWIACEKKVSAVPTIEFNSWIERMLAEKLEQKTSEIEKLLQRYNNDWEEVFYVVLARNFGFGLNGEPFERLARQTPWRIVGRNADSQVKLEALFLGQAGFLDKLVCDDEHTALLGREYAVLRQKYGIEPLPEYVWKFLRLRPVNFPTIRLVQMAALFASSPSLFNAFLECEMLARVRELLRVSPLSYWDHHYRPGVVGKKRTKMLGRQAMDLIIINTVVPFFFAYGRLRGRASLEQKAIDWLTEMPPESNTIVKNWEHFRNGKVVPSAAESQGLVYLKRNYCDHQKCLYCRIGQMIIAHK